MRIRGLDRHGRPSDRSTAGVLDRTRGEKKGGGGRAGHRDGGCFDEGPHAKSPPNRCRLTTISRAAECRVTDSPLLATQPVGDSSREQKSVQSALVFDQHAMGGAARQTHIHPELARAVVIYCVGKGVGLSGGAPPDDCHVVLLVPFGVGRSLEIGRLPCIHLQSPVICARLHPALDAPTWLATGKGAPFSDPALRVAHLERLTESGIDAAGALRSGQLEVRAWEEAYLRGQRFDQSAMLALVEKVLDDGKTRGFPLTRLIAQMEWALEDLPGVKDLLEYEIRLNYLLPKYDDPVI